jgi:hypothetical protein
VRLAFETDCSPALLAQDKAQAIGMPVTVVVRIVGGVSHSNGG